MLTALSGCRAHYPTSYHPGLYNPATGQVMVADSLPVAYRGWPDDHVLRFGHQPCADTFSRALRLSPTARKLRALPEGPGILLITNEGVGIDEAEITNLTWRQYQLFQQENGVTDSTLVPKARALPVPDYYTNRFYNLYPVVGISYEQAQSFCRWRSRIVTDLFNQKLGPADTLNPSYVRFRYRLPTEAEWEYAALRLSGHPFGTTCLTLPLHVEPGAAAYLRQRSGSTNSVAEVRAAIIAYNRTNAQRNIINCAQDGPDFLRSASPGYVYQGPPNDFGLYNMLGNAAELVQEKGLTKGGSYRDALTNCRIQARGRYNGPAPYVGFRAVCTSSRPAPTGGR